MAPSGKTEFMYEHGIELIIHKDQWYDGIENFWASVIMHINDIIEASLGEKLVKFVIKKTRIEPSISWGILTTEPLGLFIANYRDFSCKHGAVACHRENKILVSMSRMKEYCQANNLDYEVCKLNAFTMILAHEIGHEFGVLPEVYLQEAVSPDNQYFASIDRDDCMEMCAPEDPLLFFNSFHAELIKRNASLVEESEYLIKQLNNQNYPTVIRALDAQTGKIVHSFSLHDYKEKPLLLPVKVSDYTVNYAFVSTNNAIQSFIHNKPEHVIDVMLRLKEKGGEERIQKGGGLIDLLLALLKRIGGR